MSLEMRISRVHNALYDKALELGPMGDDEREMELDSVKGQAGELSGYQSILAHVEKAGGKLDALTIQAIEERLNSMESCLNIQDEKWNELENVRVQTSYEKYGAQHTPTPEANRAGERDVGHER